MEDKETVTEAAEPQSWDDLEDQFRLDAADEAGPESETAPATGSNAGPPATVTDSPAETAPEGQTQPDSGPALLDEAPEAAGPPPEPQPDTEAPPASGAAAPPAALPYRPRADGAELDLGSDAIETADGWVAIRKDRLTPYLANRNAWREERRRLKAELQQATDARSERELHAESIIALFEPLETGKLDPEEWAEKVRPELPMLRTRAEREYWKRQATVAATPPQPDAQDWEERKQESLRGYISQIAANEGVRLDADRLFDRLWNDRRLYTRAPADIPANGIRKGDEIINNDFFYPVVGAAVQVARTRYAAPEVARAKAANVAATTGRTAAPPSVRPSAAVPAGERKPINSYEDWAASIDALKP